ncbi:MAG: hypothetical protein HDR49_07585 [Bacteroides sp.]|nr:hypothetical protein [Bacteroides sp.]
MKWLRAEGQRFTNGDLARFSQFENANVVNFYKILYNSKKIFTKKSQTSCRVERIEFRVERIGFRVEIRAGAMESRDLFRQAQKRQADYLPAPINLGTKTNFYPYGTFLIG